LEALCTELANKEIKVETERTKAVNDLDKVLNAIDEDDRKQGKTKLYEVPRETWVSMTKDVNTLFYFDHIDGMYSYCVNKEGDIIHIGASTPVFIHPELQLDSPEVK
jgi:hypothetical protein